MEDNFDDGYDPISAIQVSCFDTEVDVEEIIRSSRLYKDEVNFEIFSQPIIVSESQPKVEDSPACYTYIDDFCQAMDLPQCRNVLAESLCLIMTRPVEQWLLHEHEKVKLESIILSLTQGRLYRVNDVNIICLKILVAIIKNDKYEIAEYLKQLPLTYHGKVIIHIAIVMYYLSIDISISELFEKLDALKIAVNHHMHLSKLINYLIRTTKNLLLTMNAYGPNVAQHLLKNYMKNCERYLIYLPILEQYQLRMEKILARECK